MAAAIPAWGGAETDREMPAGNCILPIRTQGVAAPTHRRMEDPDTAGVTEL